MDLKVIEKRLKERFDAGSRIVFWIDEEAQFAESITELKVINATLLDLSKIGAVELKSLLEIDKPDSQFLLYLPTPRPSPEEDWLLDLFFYCEKFSADSAEMIRDELGLQESSIREFIKDKLLFFNSGKRKEALKKLITKSDRSQELFAKMLQVLLGAQSPSLAHLLLALFEECFEEEVYEPQVLKEIEKFGLSEYLWTGVAEEYGVDVYASGSTLWNVLAQLALTEINAVLHNAIPSSLRHLVITCERRASNAAIFVSEWRDKESYRQSYLWHCKQLEEQFELGTALEEVSSKELAFVSTAESAVKICLAQARELTCDNTLTTRAEARDILSVLKANFWVTREEASYSAILRSLEAALSFLELKEEYAAGIHAASPVEFAASYEQSLWRFDYFYRQYYAGLQTKGATNFLSELSTQIDATYSDWFLSSVANVWNGFLEGGFLNKWELPNVPNQRQFFSTIVKKALDEPPKRRVAVIISDGLRFEAGQELRNRLNGKDNNEASLSMMLGVVPSYTSLGMAALLPSSELSINDNGQVIADGRDAASFETRNQAVAAHGGIALKHSDLKGLSRDEARELIGDKLLVYIYHDVIDATGDQAKTENATFSAADAAIDELESLTQMILGSLNTSVVLITADHGFLYEQGGKSQTAEVKHLTGEIIKEHKRYILGRKLDTVSKVLKGSTSATARTNNSVEVLLPYGCCRFNQYGAGSYFHGGAMPQEVFLPVVTCKKLREKAAEKAKIKKTSVTPLVNIFKITALKHSFKFIQNELVSDKVKPITVRIGFYDELGEAISNQYTVTFDAAEDSQREKSLTFSFKSQKYDRSKDYFLIIRDEETQKQLHSQAFRVTILLTDDFEGF